MPEQDQQQLIALAQDVVQRATALGASGARASASRGREVELRLRDGQIEKLQDAQSRSVSVELYVDGRYSSHSTADLSPRGLDAFLREAVALTRALVADPHRRLPDATLRGVPSDLPLRLADPALQGDFDKAAAEALLRVADARLRAEPKVISATSTYSQSSGAWALATSDGFAGSEAHTAAWMGAELTLQDEGDARPEGGDWRGGRRAADLPEPEALAKEAVRRARQRLGAKKGPSQRTQVIVEPQVAGSLIGHLLRPATGAAVQQGRSFLAGKVGQRLFSPQLTLIDDPLLPQGLGSHRFDGEGLAAARLPIIEGGVLRNLYVDTYYGSKAGLRPTTGGPSNRRFALGRGDLAQHIAQARSALLITGWLGGNSDANTGDFSLGCRGHLVRDGELGPPIGEMNVTGNLVRLFAQLSALGDDPYAYSATQTPTLVFEDVQISGA